MSDSKTQNINVTKNTAFANMLGGYNGEKEYNKRNTSWTVDSNNDGKKEVNWSKARQTFGDLLGDIAMFGIGALSGGLDDPVKGIGQGFQNVYARHNAMNAAANNYIKEKNENELLDENARKYWDFLKTRDVQGLPKTREEVNRFTWGNHNLGDVVKDYQDQDSAYWTIQDKNNIVGFDNLGNTDITQPTNTTKPQPVQTPGPGVELQIQEPGENETLPNVQPVNYLQGGVVENESAYTPDKPFHPYNPSVVNNLLNNYTSERNNIRNNQTSRANNINTVNASMYGHKVSYANAHDRIEFEKEKAKSEPKGNDVSGLVALGHNLKEFEKSFSNDGLHNPQGWGRITEPIHVGFRAMNVKNPAEVAFDARRSLLFNSIARDLGGEKGVLSDQDIERVSKGMPSLSDSPEQKQAKMDEIYKLIDVRLMSKGYQPMFGTVR